MNNLTDLRTKIDAIDTQIVALLERRIQLSKRVIDTKQKNGVEVFQPEREQEILKTVETLTTDPILRAGIQPIYREIIGLSRNYQMLVKHEFPAISSIAIIGCGVIGGSIARAIRLKTPTIRITTKSHSSRSTSQAKQEGYIDTVYESWQEIVDNNGLIILALPIDIICDTARKLSQVQSTNSVIILDVASVKKEITHCFQELSRDTMQFVATHPMAGNEKSGIDGSTPYLFVQRPWIITPHKKNTETALSTVSTCATALGAHPSELDPVMHDEYMAGVSHMPFCIATLLFAFIQEHQPESIAFAGPGFASMTRLASGNPAMHTAIFSENAVFIHLMFHRFISYVQSHPITSQNAEALFTHIKELRDANISA